MENYTWENYPLTDKQKAMLLYTGQQLQQQGMLPNARSFTSYQQPISNLVGPEYAQVYPEMNNQTINTILELMRNGYKPAVNARNGYRQLPNGYINSLANQFYFPKR